MADGGYRLDAGDKLRVVVYGQDGLTNSYAVDASGQITMPLIGPAIVAGAVFAALASFDETVVSFFISGIEHKTITRKMFEDIEFNVSPVIAAASTVFVVGTVALMWLADMAKRRAAGVNEG